MSLRFVMGLICLCCAWESFAQTQLQGTIINKENQELLIGATVAIVKDGELVRGVISDENGFYHLNITPGTYDLKVSYLGYTDLTIQGLIVYANQLNRFDAKLEAEGVTGKTVIVKHKKEIVPPDQIESGIILTRKDIQSSPSRNIQTIISQSPGVAQADDGDQISIKGSRFNSVNYYIDDIRVNGNFLIPLSEIEQMQVITGGIDAQYGDVTGGVIAITTRGPANRLKMGLELENSGWTDAFGYRLGLFNLSAPLLKRKINDDVERTMLGLRISARYQGQKDDDPAAISVARVNNETLQALQTDPVRSLGASNRPAAEQLKNEQVDQLKYRPYETSHQVNLTTRLDFRPSDRISLILTGNYSRLDDQFTPNNSWRLLNAQNNPSNQFNSYRANLSFKQRLSKTNTDFDQADQAFNPIENISYTVQLGYEKTTFEVGDPRHEDRLFDYGYIGQFDYEWVPIFGRQSGRHEDYRQEFRGYTPGDVNPVLVNYNEGVDVNNLNDLVSFNGFNVGNVEQVWGIHTNVGIVYNRFAKRNNDRYSLNVMAGFDWRPNKKSKNRHSIRFGLQYEQRINRGYEVQPNDLWNTARQQANRHILGVDTLDIVGEIDGLPVYNTLIEELSDLSFYKKVRAIAFPDLSVEEALHQYVNVDALKPGQLSLDLFTPQELTDQNIVNYWGFDYLGNLVSERASFDDFFTATNDEGVRTFPVAPDQPIYSAFFLQDKFTINNMIFRIGFRVDRFDANSKVLRDPFSLYEIKTADQFYTETGLDRPGGVADDFKVYIAQEGSQNVVGFRKGEQWYGANGQPVNDGNLIFGGGVVTPAFVNSNDNIRSRDFDPSRSFKDYEPQINVLPRIGFSFPISNVANFFAHYDVLTERPTNNRVSALEYYYFNERTPQNNPALKPSRTIEYEVGFQQKVGDHSGIKLTTYYREFRDLVQRRTFLYLPAPIGQYESYDNQDFGTVKGFTAQYTLQNPLGLTINSAYTLQFAEGTGSDTESQRGISARGNLRTIYPLDFDVRHRLVSSINYDFGSGKVYRGPILFGQKLFNQTNINLQVVANSGTPYTQNAQPDRFSGSTTIGALNGGRVPWSFTINLRANKRFEIKTNKEQSMVFNIYARVNNLMDRRNIVQVYPATGSAIDDGYLLSAQGQSELSDFERSGLDVDAFEQSYQWRLLNPDFFTLPRRIVLGVSWEL